MQFFSNFSNEVVIYGMILTLAAISGIFSERSGTVNIGIEAMMSFGGIGYALAAYIVYKIDPNFSNGIIQLILFGVAMLFGLLFGLLHGFATIKLKADHTISGVALNLLAVAAATIVVNSSFINSPTRTIPYNPQINEAYISAQWNGLEKIFSLSLLVFIIVVIASWVMLNKSSWGLRFKAVGENPQAVDVVGVNVYKIKWQGIMLSGAIAGLAGALFANKLGSAYNGNVQGLGFLGIAVMIMAHWNIGISVLTGFIFGVFQYAGTLATGSAFQELFGQEATKYSDLVRTIPYVLTLVFLISFSKLSPGPAAAGINYDKSAR
ncbi:ABC-type uncharacterized transport system, permease component [Mycoplasmopsis maculosa]|uniref:ABC-type uncharacterized transport system, permease component n=1 Tax=Mycoplasmopsis maculosa TaxID=114885 RepID=A0A449B539_9BACT|nr:ABC transporter permease [Mycoplasmopsis maculosa]VEU75710.1 ABC-type uncharacterized transport system, permease component [Mycoplasmopsis maculosa]